LYRLRGMKVANWQHGPEEMGRIAPRRIAPGRAMLAAWNKTPSRH